MDNRKTQGTLERRQRTMTCNGKQQQKQQKKKQNKTKQNKQKQKSKIIKT